MVGDAPYHHAPLDAMHVLPGACSKVFTRSNGYLTPAEREHVRTRSHHGTKHLRTMMLGMLASNVRHQTIVPKETNDAFFAGTIATLRVEA